MSTDTALDVYATLIHILLALFLVASAGAIVALTLAVGERKERKRQERKAEFEGNCADREYDRANRAEAALNELRQRMRPAGPRHQAPPPTVDQHYQQTPAALPVMGQPDPDTTLVFHSGPAVAQ